MSKRLADNISSKYFEAANRMTSKKARRRIVAYVESYDDILFWRTVLNRFENERRYFEVMLPSKKKLQRGKKSVLMNFIESDDAAGSRVGRDMIACVDADYDYLMQRATPMSQRIIDSPYVFHTYVYAIENYQCYAPSLHNVCVMVTLNDHAVFDFEEYLRLYSEACFPLFVWSIWAYRTNHYPKFTLTDFTRIIETGGFSLANPMASIEHLRGKVGRKVRQLQAEFPGAKESYLRLKSEIKQLGVTPQTTYLYIQGHHLFDAVVAPIVSKVCNRLRQERENEIYHTAQHSTQRKNEMSCYENSLQDIRQMMKKNMGYVLCPQFLQLQEEIGRYLDACEQTPGDADRVSCGNRQVSGRDDQT